MENNTILIIIKNIFSFIYNKSSLFSTILLLKYTSIELGSLLLKISYNKTFLNLYKSQSSCQ